jgi:hypothetical protein
VAVNGQPLLLSFGQTGLSDLEWTQCLGQLKTPVTYFSQHQRRTAAVGAFDWPVPKETLTAVARFQKESTKWQASLPVAFPRFVDIYAEAKVGASYGRFDDDGGLAFRTMLSQGLVSGAPCVQLATWNDWGEGTHIEPSVEFGYRDLETIHELCQTRSSIAKADLQLPRELLELRRARPSSSEHTKKLDEAALLISAGQIAQARIVIKALR